MITSSTHAAGQEDCRACNHWERNVRIFISIAYCRYYIRVRPNRHLDSSRILLQIVMKIFLLVESRIITAFNVYGVDFQEIAGMAASRFHFDFRCVHNSRFLSPHRCGHNWLLGTYIQNSQKKKLGYMDGTSQLCEISHIEPSPETWYK